MKPQPALNEDKAELLFEELMAVVDPGMRKDSSTSHLANSILATAKLQSKLLTTYGQVFGRNELVAMLDGLKQDILKEHDRTSEMFKMTNAAEVNHVGKQ